MQIDDLMDIAQKFSNYGDAIGAQVKQVLEEVTEAEDIDDLLEDGHLNSNALRYVVELGNYILQRHPSIALREEVEAVLAAVKDWQENGASEGTLAD